jgi:hypothetical protein
LERDIGGKRGGEGEKSDIVKYIVDALQRCRGRRKDGGGMELGMEWECTYVPVLEW